MAFILNTLKYWFGLQQRLIKEHECVSLVFVSHFKACLLHFLGKNFSYLFQGWVFIIFSIQKDFPENASFVCQNRHKDFVLNK